MRACKTANDLPNNTDLSEGFPDSWDRQELRFDQWTVVNPQTGCNADGIEVTRNVKSQCMQCLEPTCVSVCLVGALTKSELGPILYNADRCIGCRYCIMACPFDIPKFEWEGGMSPVIGKCQFCTRKRLAEGRIPACVESCPTGALKFGRRNTLLFEAKARIDSHPERYINHIYGENEAGGTAWLYMSDVPFENLGFKSDLETAPLPPLTWDVLSKIPIVAAAMAGLFGTLAWSLNRREKPE
jgi:formate dehydrogenase iron-sulfur subunit